MPPLMSYRKAPSLRDKLVKSDIGTSRRDTQTTCGPPRKGNFPCLNSTFCNNMLKGDTFSHPHSGKRFQIHDRYTCSSKYVVYMISCPCGLIYIGETTMEVRKRITKHKSTIRNKMVELPIPKHFIERNHYKEVKV